MQQLRRRLYRKITLGDRWYFAVRWENLVSARVQHAARLWIEKFQEAVVLDRWAGIPRVHRVRLP